MYARSGGRRVPARRVNSLLRRRRTTQSPPRVDAADYRCRGDAPERAINGSGHYQAGWYRGGETALNVTDSAAPAAHLQGWIHLSFLGREHFVVADIADLTRAGNTSALVMHRPTGRFEEGSVKHVLKNHVAAVKRWQRLEDASNRSFIEISADKMDFHVHVDGVEVEGEAKLVDEPFIQITAAHEGHGVVQRWGHLSVVDAVARWPGGEVRLEEGTLGAFDHTVGHRRRLQNWNWLSVLGNANDGTRFSMQMARDQSGARPIIDALKTNLWIDGALHKLADLTFDYAIDDTDLMSTSPWRIHGGRQEGAWIDLVFKPRFQRRNKERVPLLFEVDFNQYYGEVDGSFGLGGRSWGLQNQFGLTEDSWMML